MTPGQLAGWIGVAVLFMVGVAICESMIFGMIQKHKKAKGCDSSARRKEITGRSNGTSRGLGE